MVPGPTVTLNRIVALAMVHGPETGLHALQLAEPALTGQHRVAAVRAHLLDLAGHPDQAREHYALAAQQALNLPERHYLQTRADAVQLSPDPPDG
jgi:predicted RNA polymerase sigma factor